MSLVLLIMGLSIFAMCWIMPISYWGQESGSVLKNCTFYVKQYCFMMLAISLEGKSIIKESMTYMERFLTSSG
ncbi:hypothetical protein DMX09_22170 [Pseudomonas protegens]|nr:hypothetical protein DMX09_22170 [Pseudomonas protegens]